MAVGPVVRPVAEQFDLDWNSGAAAPIGALRRDRPSAEEVARARTSPWRRFKAWVLSLLPSEPLL